MSLLVLGATSRMALETARVFAGHGHDVFLADLDGDEARRLAADLSIRHRVRAAGGGFEATDFDRHEALLDLAEEAVGPVEVALLAFGTMGDQERSQQDIQAARQVIDVNYTAAVSLCERLAERMVERGRGSIIGISSVAGDRGRQGNYVYGSAKGAFALYLQGLRSRLHDQGVHVMTVKPGFVDTRMTWGMETGLPVADPARVGRALYRGWRARRDVLYVPRFWAGIMGVIRAVPERIFKRLSF